MAVCSSLFGQDAQVVVYPAPDNKALSDAYEIEVEGQKVPVYKVKVAPRNKDRRWRAMDDIANSHGYFDNACFAYFDMKGKVKVKVTIPVPVAKAKILPSSWEIKPIIKGNSVSFSVSDPRNLTIEINDEWIQSLHLFVNPLERDVPKAGDPNVIYFGPGIHRINKMVVGDNKTIYIAGGAILQAVVKEGESFVVNQRTGIKRYAPAIELRGRNITIRGRGVIDASRCPTHTRNIMSIQGSNIRIEGVILQDSPTWTMPVVESDTVMIDNVKLLGYRANSDGIDIVGSSHVTVDRCFVRTLDDLIVIKTPIGSSKGAKHIKVRNCVLWNQLAHALSVGAEITKDIDDVYFSNCDIIHDQSREWSLRIFHADSALVSNIHFEDIRIEESIKCISLWVNSTIWSRTLNRGNIKNVWFKNIQAKGQPLTVELIGFNKDHRIENIFFQNVKLNNRLLTDDMIQKNRFVKNVHIEP